jgi:hypothetical protein
MTDRFKDFGAGSSLERSAIKFKLHGEEFECVSEIQGKVLLDMVSRSQSDDPVVAAGVVTDFFNKVLTDESLERFDALIVDKERIVTMETLSDIVAWLIEEYTGRPNQQPED